MQEVEDEKDECETESRQDESHGRKTESRKGEEGGKGHVLKRQREVARRKGSARWRGREGGS